MKAIIIFVGGSGSGKTTLLNHLAREMNIPRVITQTTRSMREGEVDGVDYNFKSSPLSFFEEDLVESDLYQNDWYGTSFKSVSDSFKLNDTIALAMTEKGLHAFRENMKRLGADKIIAFKLLAPDSEVQRQRLIERGDSLKDIDERIHIDKKGYEAFASLEEGVGLYNEVIVNDDFETTVNNINGIFRIEGLI